MITTILGTKLKQTQAYTNDGKRMPVTLISAGPCWVTSVDVRDTSTRIQLGFGTMKHATKALLGQMKKAGITEKPRFLRTVAMRGDTMPAVGEMVTVDRVFQVGDRVAITGTSKGKGFAGVVKRHGFRGGPRTHGQSDRERAPGSIGQTTTPGRVYKGKRMAGRMGSDRVTVRGLSVVAVDSEHHMLTVKGLVPGGRNGLLIVSKE